MPDIQELEKDIHVSEIFDQSNRLRETPAGPLDDLGSYNVDTQVKLAQNQQMLWRESPLEIRARRQQYESCDQPIPNASSQIDIYELPLMASEQIIENVGQGGSDPRSVRFEGTTEHDDEVVMVTKPLADRVTALKDEKAQQRSSGELRDVDIYRKFIRP